MKKILKMYNNLKRGLECKFVSQIYPSNFIRVIFIPILIFLLVVSVGCAKKVDKDKTDFVRGSNGLVMSFVENFPQDEYILSDVNEPISIVVDIWNKGVHPEPPKDDNPSTLEEETIFKGSSSESLLYIGGIISISGFDRGIINMDDDKYSKNFFESDVYLPAASELNPLGGLYTAEFDGNIMVDNILVDKYEPTILVTACYPYFTIDSPTVCIDPFPFDTKQEKVCTIGSKEIGPQGAPIAITKIEQEATSKKIRFKITIENVGKGDVIWPEEGVAWSFELNKLSALMDRCSPIDLGQDSNILNRKDFDKVQIDKLEIADVDLLEGEKCTALEENNIVRLFDGEGFFICTYDVPDTTQSAYTTPMLIKLSYGYRSTISKPISIRKIE